MRPIVSTMLCVAVVLGAGASRADDVPPGCQESARTVRAYNSGFQQGLSLVESAWMAVDDCDQLELFSDLVIANVENYVLTGSSAYVVCRYTGMTDGVYAGLDEVWLQCGGDCCDEGEAIGELAAEIYCQLSILLGGLGEPDLFVRRPVWTCGFSFQTCCDSMFVGFSQDFPECLPYTEDPYYDIWDGTRVMQCSYTPPDPPPTKLDEK